MPTTSPATAVLHRERLVPPPAAHLVSLLVAATVGLGLSYWGPVPGIVGAVLGLVGTSLVLVRSSPVVTVVADGDPADGGGAGVPRLRAGRAVVPADALGPGEVLGATELRAALSVEADPRAHVCQRSWVRTAVRLPVVDPRDTTPYWLVSTRRPGRVLAALGR